MAKIIEKTGKTVEEALQAALAELEASAEEVDVEVLESPSKGFFGFGAKPAKIQVKLKEIQPPLKAESAPVEKFEAQESKVESEVENSGTNFQVSKIENSGTKNEISMKTNFSAGTENFSAGIENQNSESENNFESETKTEKVADFDRDAVIDKAKSFLAEVCGKMKVDVTITAQETDDGVVLDLAGKNLGVLIGKHGQTLDALQYLTNLTSNHHDAPEKIRFILDVENYRARRAETLEKLAKSVAERVIRLHQDVKLEPMSRHERKIIHTVLQDNDKIETHSAGEDPYRYIVVSPKKRGR